MSSVRAVRTVTWVADGGSVACAVCPCTGPGAVIETGVATMSICADCLNAIGYARTRAGDAPQLHRAAQHWFRSADTLQKMQRRLPLPDTVDLPELDALTDAINVLRDRARALARGSGACMTCGTLDDRLAAFCTSCGASRT